MRTPEEMYRRGLALSHAGRYAAARSQFVAALARAVEPDTLARTMLSLAYVEAELESTERGLARCAEALTVGGIGPQVRGLVQSQIALLHVRAGAGDSALAAFESAIALLDESPEPLARAHLNRGLVYLQRGDVSRAEADEALAAELYRQADEPDKAAKADHNRGYALLLTGDLVAALRLMESAADALTGLSASQRAVILQDRAEALIAAGMPVDAESLLEQAARAYASRGLWLRQSDVELILARSLAQREPRRAATVARRAQRRLRRRGNTVWALRAEAVELAAQIEAGSVRPEHVDRADDLTKSLAAAGLAGDSARMRAAAVRAALGCGDLVGARRRLLGLRPGSSAPLGVRLDARQLRAEAARAGGRRSQALAHVRAGLADLQSWQATFGSLDLQSSVVGHGQRLAVTGARLAIEDGRSSLVLEWMERARAMTSRVTPMRPPADPRAAQALAALRAAPDEQRAAALRREIRQRAWYGAGSHSVAEPVSLDRLSAALGNDGASLVSYLALDGVLWALVVSADGARLTRLEGLAEARRLLAGLQADLDMAATELPETFHGVVVAALRGRLAALGELLVEPVADLLGTDRVVVIPSGALAGATWTLLPDFAGRALTVASSASWWVATRTRERSAPARVGIVVGPGVGRGPEEARLVGSSWLRATTLAGADATADAVSELAGRVDLLHVAAHGRHSAENALFSGVVLADGPWFGYDIDQLISIPSHVVLSACEVGRSTLRWGEEAVGMTAAWLHAGAACVVAAPAHVADSVACDLLSAMHARLARGVSAAEALALAVREVPEADLAGFTCYGAAW